MYHSTQLIDAQHRYVNYYLTKLSQSEATFQQTTAHPQQAFQLVDSDWEQICKAHHICTDMSHNNEAMLSLAARFGLIQIHFLDRKQNLQEQMVWYQRTAEAARIVRHPQAYLSSLLALGRIAVRRADYQQAQTHIEEALKQVRHNDLLRSSLAVDLLIERGNVHLHFDEDEQAQQVYEEALHLVDNLDEAKQRIIANLALAELQRKRNALEAAEAYIRTCLSILEKHPDPLQQALALHRLGNILTTNRRQTEAVQCFQHALNIYETYEDVRGLVKCHRSLVIAFQGLDRLNDAENHGQVALKHVRKLSEPRELAFLLMTLGMLAHAQANYALAEKRLQECYEICVDIQDTIGMAMLNLRLGRLYSEMGVLEAAQLRLEQSLTTFREMKDSWGIGMCLNGLAQVANQQENYETAILMANEALAHVQKLGDSDVKLDTQLQLGIAHTLSKANRQAAKTNLRQAFLQARRAEKQIVVLKALLHIAILYQATAQQHNLARLFLTIIIRDPNSTPDMRVQANQYLKTL